MTPRYSHEIDHSHVRNLAGSCVYALAHMHALRRTRAAKAHGAQRTLARHALTCRADYAESGALEDAWDDSTGSLVAPPPVADAPPAPPATIKPTLKRSNSAVRAMKKVESMLSRGNSAASTALDPDSFYSAGPRGLRSNSVAAALADLGAWQSLPQC